MPVVEKEYDSWNNNIYGLPYALYLYYLDEPLDFEGQYSSVLGNLTGLVSMNYVPYMNSIDLELFRISYDSGRFGAIDKMRPELTTTPKVFRINSLLNPSKFISEFKPYKVTGKNIGGKRDWRNEGKLYNYPYSYCEVNDGINPPLILRPELCPDICHVGVKLSLSERCSHSIFIQGYKGDTHGFVEALVSGDGAELPTTGNQYANWYATSKNQTTQNVMNTIAQSKLGEQFKVKGENLGMVTDGIGAVANVIGSALSLNFGGALMGGVQGVGQYYQHKLGIEQAQAQGKLDRQSVIKSAMAQASDMKTAPNTLISQGANIMYGIRNNDRKLRLYRFGITEEYAQRIGDYFALFGYKQNRMMKVDKRNRKFYNYIKMLQCNVKGDGIPNNYLDEIKSIYEKGVRIWHVDRTEFTTVGDYSRDNFEV